MSTAAPPVPVDAAAIERGLAAMWKRAGEAGAVTRVCTLNLVVWAVDAREEREAAECVARVAERHPCRALLLLEARSEETEIGAEVAARCGVPLAGAAPVCGEEIRLRTPAARLGALPSLVRLLAVPEVPVVLLAPAAALGDPVVAELARDAGLVLTGAFGDECSAHAWPVAAAGATPVLDLGWTRSRGWRDLAAQFFDEPGAAAAAAGIDRIEISHGGAEPGAAPLLLAGWLATRLGWELRTAVRHDGGVTATYAARAGQAAELAFHPAPAAAAAGCVTTLRLVAGARRWEIERLPAGAVRTRASDGDHVLSERAVRLTEREPWELVAIELGALTVPSAYTAAAGAAAALVAAAGGGG